ncbi:MAG: tetratricopeptide repeat protein [Bdellovibrionales bacterium]|nr:tetratricopeptide repeat protein [Bdellovibrionales bacterium]
MEKFQQYVRLAGEGADTLAVERQVGDLLFEELGEYSETVKHYEAMITRRPADPERARYLFRVGRSYFFLWRFSESIATFERISREFSGTHWAERAAFEIGLAHFTSGGHRSGTENQVDETVAYRKAIAAYEAFLKTFPGSALRSRAAYGIASCYEELDQLDTAYRKYQEILESYPSPNVIKIKLARIRERLAQRGTDKPN